MGTAGRVAGSVGRRVFGPVAFGLLVTLLILAPLAVRGIPRVPPDAPPDAQAKRIEFGYPLVYRGDEPHYVLMITSLVRDGDLDLANNYTSVHNGGDDAGYQWKDTPDLDNHTAAVIGGKRVVWEWVYDYRGRKPEEWAYDEGGRWVPPRFPGKEPFPPGVVQRSVHQPGVAFLLYPVLYPIRDRLTGSPGIESAALAAVGVFVAAGFWFTRWLFLGLGAGPWRATGAAAVAILATPAWYYARTLFMEGITLALLAAAYAVYLRRGWAVGAGLLLAASLHFKAYLALLAVPIAADLLVRREWRGFVGFSLAVGAGVATVLAVNAYYYGGPFTPAQPFAVGSFREGGYGLLLNTQYGLLPFCPAVYVAAVRWPHFFRTRPREAAVLLAPVLLLFVLMAFYKEWDGRVYGPRYLVPIMPFLFVSLASPGPDPVFRRLCGPQLAAVLIAVSVVMNGAAVFDHWWCWMRNPALEFAAWLRVPPP
jgi:hypothetical protein